MDLCSVKSNTSSKLRFLSNLNTLKPSYMQLIKNSVLDLYVVCLKSHTVLLILFEYKEYLGFLKSKKFIVSSYDPEIIKLLSCVSLCNTVTPAVCSWLQLLLVFKEIYLLDCLKSQSKILLSSDPVKKTSFSTERADQIAYSCSFCENILN